MIRLPQKKVFSLWYPVGFFWRGDHLTPRLHPHPLGLSRSDAAFGAHAGWPRVSQSPLSSRVVAVYGAVGFGGVAVDRGVTEMRRNPWGRCTLGPRGQPCHLWRRTSRRDGLQARRPLALSRADILRSTEAKLERRVAGLDVTRDPDLPAPRGSHRFMDIALVLAGARMAGARARARSRQRARGGARGRPAGARGASRATARTQSKSRADLRRSLSPSRHVALARCGHRSYCARVFVDAAIRLARAVRMALLNEQEPT